MQYRSLVVVPCFNESGNIARVLNELTNHCPGCDVLVIDDGSTDQTAHEARPFGQVVRLAANLGIGGAVQTGIKYAQKHDYDFCFQVDGDGQHPAEEVNKFFDAYRERPANLILGSRFLNKSGFQSTRLRRMGIGMLKSMIGAFTGITVTDPTSGFRMLDRKAIKIFSTDYPLDYPEPVSLLIATENGLAVREIPTEMRAREHGVSSITGLKTVAYMIRVSFYLLFVRLRRYL